MEIWYHLGTQTPGDPQFYTRWNAIGEQPGEYDTSDKVTVLIVDHRILVNERLLEQYPNVKTICTPNTAHTHIQVDLKARGIQLISLQGEQEFLRGIRSVSEYVFYYINLSSKRDHGFSSSISEKKIGIVGYGRIGKHVEEIADAYRMHVFKLDEYSKESEWVNLFSVCDFITIHLPENEQTKNAVSRFYLNLMKPTAVLINTARASVLDEKHLEQILLQRKITGAAIDVTEIEWDRRLTMEGGPLILTNHIAGSSIGDRIKTDEFLVEKTKRILGI